MLKMTANHLNGNLWLKEFEVNYLFVFLCVQKKPPEKGTRPAWAGFKTAEEGRTKIM